MELGNPGRRTMKGSSWQNLQPGKEGINSLGKNDKGKNNQKVESEKVRFRSLSRKKVWRLALEGRPRMES